MTTRETSSVLVSEFDGTMTRNDFYKLAIESLIPPGTSDYWAEYRAGDITHFEGLRRYFAAIRATEDEVLAVVERMELDPQLPAAVNALRHAGWIVVVTSAGCDWYIRRLLKEANVDIEVHSNPGRLVPGQGLLMQMPKGSPYLSPTLGVDKAAVVRRHTAKREGRSRSPAMASRTPGPPDLYQATCASPVVILQTCCVATDWIFNHSTPGLRLPDSSLRGGRDMLRPTQISIPTLVRSQGRSARPLGNLSRSRSASPGGGLDEQGAGRASA